MVTYYSVRMKTEVLIQSFSELELAVTGYSNSSKRVINNVRDINEHREISAPNLWSAVNIIYLKLFSIVFIHNIGTSERKVRRNLTYLSNTF